MCFNTYTYVYAVYLLICTTYNAQIRSDCYCVINMNKQTRYKFRVTQPYAITKLLLSNFRLEIAVTSFIIRKGIYSKLSNALYFGTGPSSISISLKKNRHIASEDGPVPKYNSFDHFNYFHFV